MGGRVRQITVLKLGRNFAIKQRDCPMPCLRLEQRLQPQDVLLGPGCAAHIERAAQRYAANFGLYKKLKKRFPGLKIIASGGISSVSDLEELSYIKVHGAIVGKAIYEHKIKLSELKDII